MGSVFDGRYTSDMGNLIGNWTFLFLLSPYTHLASCWTSWFYQACQFTIGKEVRRHISKGSCPSFNLSIDKPPHLRRTYGCLTSFCSWLQASRLLSAWRQSEAKKCLHCCDLTSIIVLMKTGRPTVPPLRLIDSLQTYLLLLSTQCPLVTGNLCHFFVFLCHSRQRYSSPPAVD